MYSAGQSNYDKCVLSAQIFADKITDSWLLLGFQRLFGWVPYSLSLCSSELCHFSTAFFCNEIHQKICISFNIISLASPNNTLLQTPQKSQFRCTRVLSSQFLLKFTFKWIFSPWRQQFMNIYITAYNCSLVLNSKWRYRYAP